MPTPRKVLIIDDETDLCLLLKEYFLRKHYQVSIAHTLTEGTALLNTMQPDVLFLDNNLPDGIGWNIAPKLAKEWKNMFIVLFSAFRNSVPKMPAAARFRVIEKPISFTDLDKQFSDL